MPVVPHQVLRSVCRVAQPPCDPVLIFASPQVSRAHANEGALPSPDGQPGLNMIQHEPTGAPGAAMTEGGGSEGGGGERGDGGGGCEGGGGEGGGGEGVPNTRT